MLAGLGRKGIGKVVPVEYRPERGVFIVYRGGMEQRTKFG